MDQKDLSFFKKWFSDYCKSFYSDNEEDRKNILLKEQHTHNVCLNIVGILSRSPGFSAVPGSELPAQDLPLIAETIALFHDIGRFPQYARYKTFRDAISVNHGCLGAEVLREKKVLSNLPGDEQELILQSVKYHNAFVIPEIKPPEAVMFLKLIRDADKLDIWQLFTEYYDMAGKDRASAFGLGLPDLPGYSDEVITSILRKRMVSISEIRSLTDFRLLQLSWVYDLNFKGSFSLLHERDFIIRLSSKLPQADEIKVVVKSLQEFVQERLYSA